MQKLVYSYSYEYRVKAAAIMNYWRAAAFLASLGSDGPGAGPALAACRSPLFLIAASLSTVLWMVLTLTWMPRIDVFLRAYVYLLMDTVR